MRYFSIILGIFTLALLSHSCGNDDDLSNCEPEDGFRGTSDVDLMTIMPEQMTYNSGDTVVFTFEVDAINSIVLDNFNMLEYTGDIVGELVLPSFTLFAGNQVNFISGEFFGGVNGIIVPYDITTGTYRAVAEVQLNRTGTYSFVSRGEFNLSGSDCRIVSITSFVDWSVPEGVEFEVLP
jgi:hypothetical protein